MWTCAECYRIPLNDDWQDWYCIGDRLPDHVDHTVYYLDTDGNWWSVRCRQCQRLGVRQRALLALCRRLREQIDYLELHIEGIVPDVPRVRDA